MKRILAVLGTFTCVALLVGCGGKQELPVDVTFRKSLVGMGQVLQLENRTSRDLTLAVHLEYPTTNEEKDGKIHLAANEFQECGWMETEGWIFSSGGSVTLYHSAYRKKTIRVP
jgi:hypothetical protein